MILFKTKTKDWYVPNPDHILRIWQLDDDTTGVQLIGNDYVMKVKCSAEEVAMQVQIAKMIDRRGQRGVTVIGG